MVKINFHGTYKSISTVLKINFHPPWHPQTSVPATRAQVTLSFAWLAFAVKTCHTLVWLAGIRGKTCHTLVWLAGIRGKTCSTANRASFTANANQSNGSVTCARVAGTEVCGCHRGRKLIFYHPGNWFFTIVEIDFYYLGKFIFNAFEVLLFSCALYCTCI